MKILIIIPAYNESENIVRVVDILINNYSEYDYVIVNDGSSDNTSQICMEHKYNFINLPVNLGLAGGFQAGMRYAYLNNYDLAIQFDGDGQHDPSYIKSMSDEMYKIKADIIIGSRFKESRKPKSTRMLGSNLIQKAIFITSKKNITDPTSGMRLYNRIMIREFANNMNYGPEPDTISYLIRCGIKVEEVQVTMNERLAGESYLNMKRAFQYMIRMFASIVFIQFFRERSA